MDDTADILWHYARKKNFCYEHDREKNMYAFVGDCLVENPLCADVLRVRAYRISKTRRYAFFHEGRYCSLVHASSEFLCETCYGKKKETADLLARKMFSKETEQNTDNEELQNTIFLEMSNRLSQRRLECFLLPYRAFDILIRKLFEEEKHA